MAELQRYRVKSHQQTWNAEGPDLLRTQANARLRMAAMIGDGYQDRLVVRRNWQGRWTKWTGPYKRVGVLEAFDEWKAPQGGVFQVAINRKQPKLLVEARGERVDQLYVADVHAGVVVAWSLARHQFPDVEFGGGFVCKQSAPGYTSNHAWKDAIDETPPNGSYNDELFDWNRRMCATGNMQSDQIIGSLNGRVVIADTPDWDVRASGADSSHLWHVHISVIDHHGANSPYCSSA